MVQESGEFGIDERWRVSRVCAGGFETGGAGAGGDEGGGGGAVDVCGCYGVECVAEGVEVGEDGEGRGEGEDSGDFGGGWWVGAFGCAVCE